MLKYFILEPFDKYGKTPEEGLWEFSVKPIENYFKFYGELMTGTMTLPQYAGMEVLILCCSLDDTSVEQIEFTAETIEFTETGIFDQESDKRFFDFWFEDEHNYAMYYLLSGTEPPDEVAEYIKTETFDLENSDFAVAYKDRYEIRFDQEIEIRIRTAVKKVLQQEP